MRVVSLMLVAGKLRDEQLADATVGRRVAPSRLCAERPRAGHLGGKHARRAHAARPGTDGLQRRVLIHDEPFKAGLRRLEHN